MLRLCAPAKINLFLEITGKRPDGYHTLAILFQAISLADTLTFFPADRLSLTCSDPTLPTDDTNLVMRAAVKIQKELRETRGARIHLKKVIPMGAGLGGGSSDAASVLLGLPKLWNRRASEAVRRRSAKSLGADVPFFLRKGLCAAGGIGDRLRPLAPLPKVWLVLVYPGFGVATKEAYGRVRLPFSDSQSPRRILGFISEKNPRWQTHLFNRFESLVFPDHPALAHLKRSLMEAGAAGALMSGSGSSVFGIAPSKAAGLKILAGIRQKYPQSWLVHTLGLHGRHPRGRSRGSIISV